MLHEIVLETLAEIARIFFYGLFYAIGWPFMKLLTLGSYPRKNGWRDHKRDGLWTAMLGTVIVIVTVMAVCGQF
ncbi:hypothetical protein ACX3YG_09990 [Pseudomonas wadenswilerensis]